MKIGIGTRPSNGYRPLSKCISLWRTLTSSLLWYSVVGVLGVQCAVADSSNGTSGEDRWKNLGKGVLQDARTKLEWLQNDNGDDINWKDAKSYCNRRQGGWRLPSLPELKAIYDQREKGIECAQAICKVSSEFHLTGTWFWSATQVGKDSTDGIELAWGVLLANGAQTQTVREASYGSRVLCTRGPI